MKKCTYAAMLRTLKQEIQQTTRSKQENDKSNTKIKTKMKISNIYRSKIC